MSGTAAPAKAGESAHNFALAFDVGSTLLLKGLEADHTVIVDADVMKATDLYVAISRGSRSLTVVSKSPLLPVVR